MSTWLVRDERHAAFFWTNCCIRYSRTNRQGSDFVHEPLVRTSERSPPVNLFFMVSLYLKHSSRPVIHQHCCPTTVNIFDAQRSLRQHHQNHGDQDIVTGTNLKASSSNLKPATIACLEAVLVGLLESPIDLEYNIHSRY
jgi:hypothetical protein